MARTVLSAALAFALGVALLATPGQPQAQTPASGEDASLAQITRGGRLYDNWYSELNQPAPQEAHPAYPADGPQMHSGDPLASGGRTWLCVEGHGGDSRGGVTGPTVPGLAAYAGADRARIEAILGDDTHRYDEVLAPRDIADLAAFVAFGQSHLVADIDPATRQLRGAASTATGKVYQTVCARCHGGDGKAVESIRPLGDVARENPWMVMHNILNGHAGGNMPSLRALSESVAVDTLATMQSLPSHNPIAMAARGGRLYSDWIRETEHPSPRDPHPLWPASVPASSVAETWRCRECHSWDYQGAEGAAGAAGPAAVGGPFPETMTRETIIATLIDPRHGYRGRLSYPALHDLAQFLLDGRFTMEWVIDPQAGTFFGTGEGFVDHYDTLCASCHGATGTAVRTMSPLGRVVRENPWRALHNVLNGHAGENMPPMRVFPEDLAVGILSYVENTLPSQR